MKGLDKHGGNSAGGHGAKEQHSAPAGEQHLIRAGPHNEQRKEKHSVAHEKHHTGIAGLTEKCSCGDSFHNLLMYVSNEINDFIAMLFILFTLGAIYGWYIATSAPNTVVELMAAPLIAGAIAFYNRDFAVLIFGIVIGIVIIL